MHGTQSGIIGSFSLFNRSIEGMLVDAGKISATLKELSSEAAEQGIRRPLRIAIFGFGTVGSSAARILVEQKPQGLELTHIFNRGVARKRVDWVPSTVIWSEDADAVLSSDVDVVVELAGQWPWWPMYQSVASRTLAFTSSP